MTWEEVLEIGERKVAEYEPRLKAKIKGIKPYNNSYSKPLSDRYDGSVLSATPDFIGERIGYLLEKLIKLDGTFWMSAPDCKSAQSGCEFGYVPGKNALLEFANCYQDQAFGWRLTCWYVDPTIATD
jgi:hypothetical protein